MDKKRKGKTRKGQLKAKDLAPRKQTAHSVKGGRVFRITNVRANAAGISAGPTGVGQLIKP